jgi:hypothetical protein
VTGFSVIANRQPQILYKRQKFPGLTEGRFSTSHPNISNKNAGGYAQGISEYVRLEKAISLDREAALKSASWGIGQVMGFNHAIVGYDSVESMVADIVFDEDR